MKATKEVHKFELLVERSLYTHLVKQLNAAWDNGIQYHVLGSGLHTFYPCVCFFCGDDPCQHRISGLQESNTRYGCVYCLYPTFHGVVYDPNVHLPRDSESLKALCSIAEEISKAEITNSVRLPLTSEQKNAIDTLKNQNVHPHVNPFHYCPLGGYDNNIYKANPPDLLHLFCAGLMKSLTQWTLTIIMQVNSKNKNKIALFDSRINNFPYVSNMPHLNWNTFKGGIMQFAVKSKKEKLLATGSFGGFRSTSFISALFQIYHCIGLNDDILPNTYQHRLVAKEEELRYNFKNVRTKVRRAIESVLDIYFDCKRKDWCSSTLSVFQNKLSIMEAHVTLVWELKQALINPNTSKIFPNKMRNLHKHIHLPMYIENYGSLLHMDTSTFESYHKVATTAIWQKTSKRHNGLFYEMINGIMQYDFNRMLKIVDSIVEEGMEYTTKKSNRIDGVRFRRLLNASQYHFLITFDNAEFVIENEEDPDYWKSVSAQSCINTPEKFREFLFQNDVGYSITYSYPSIEWNEQFAINYETAVIHGISFTSDDDSQMGEGTIYATTRYNKNDRKDDFADKPRYDFVLINYNDQAILVRVLLMFAIYSTKDDNESPRDEKIMLLVQLMHKSEALKEEAILGDLYMWTAGDTYQFYYDIVSVQCIMRPVFVVPLLREGYNQLNPSHLDRFVALDRSFFDRSGWEIENNSGIRFEGPEDQEAFMLNQQTDARLFTKASSTQNNEEEKTGDDDYDSGVEESDDDL